MNLIGGSVLPATWVLLGLVIVVASLSARRHRVAYAIGIWAVSILWLVAGAGANLAMLIDGATYSEFASGSPIPFVRDTWESLVVPNRHFFIGLLVTFEALVGAAVLRPGRSRTVSLSLLIAFNATLVVFGWGFLIWSAPLVFALVLLRRGPKVSSRRPPDPPDPHVPDRDTELSSVMIRADTVEARRP